MERYIYTDHFGYNCCSYTGFKTAWVKEAILFGSYAEGTATEQTDIDLYVDSGLRGLNFFGLLGDVCDTFSIPVDLVDRRMLTSNPGFKTEIFDTGYDLLYDNT